MFKILPFLCMALFISLLLIAGCGGNDDDGNLYLYKVSYINGDVDTVSCTTKPEDMDISVGSGITYLTVENKDGYNIDLISVRRMQHIGTIFKKEPVIKLKNSNKEIK